MSRKIRITESWLSEVIKETLNDSSGCYGAWACDNIVENVVRKLRESSEGEFDKEDEGEDGAYYEPIDFFEFEDILERNGYAHHNSYEGSWHGRRGIRYEISPYAYSGYETTEPETLLRELRAASDEPNDIFLSYGHYRYAPEIKGFSIVMLYS